jgi:hypothetical protein
MYIKNKERKNSNLCLFFLILGISVVTLPLAFLEDVPEWGYALIFLGAVDVIISFILFIMFIGRARVYEEMFNNQNVLAYWKYPDEFWEKENIEDMKQTGIGKIAGFFIGGIFLLIGIIIFLADTEENALFFLIMLAVSVIFVVVGFAATAAEKSRIKLSKPEAIISKRGLFFKNTLYTWHSKKIAYLESVSINPEDQSMLLFVIRQLSGGVTGKPVHYHAHNISIPIPQGMENSALDIINYFSSYNR